MENETVIQKDCRTVEGSFSYTREDGLIFHYHSIKDDLDLVGEALVNLENRVRQEIQII